MKSYITKWTRLRGLRHYRELSLQNITDRTVSKALQLCLKRFWRDRIPDFDPSVREIYRQIDRQIRQHSTFILAIDDINDCYPSAVINFVMESHREHITHCDLLWIIERVVRGHEDRENQSGLLQGSPYSPDAMNVLLHGCFDTLIEERCQRTTLLHRYVDNLAFLSRSVSEAQDAIHNASDILRQAQLTLKGVCTFGEPQDIRDPEHQMNFLGLIPRWRNDQLEFSIPESAYEHLEQGIRVSHSYPAPTRRAKKVANGWINSIEPALTRASVNHVVERVRDYLCHYGFREINISEIRNTARQTCARWQGFMDDSG